MCDIKLHHFHGTFYNVIYIVIIPFTSYLSDVNRHILQIHSILSMQHIVTERPIPTSSLMQTTIEITGIFALLKSSEAGLQYAKR